MQAPLIVIAEAIDSARLLANQNERTAPQVGVYGTLVTALKDTLDLITGDWNRALDVYASILDGNSVEQALDAVQGTCAMFREAGSCIHSEHTK
ncbi:hypothetical protein SEA_ODYSSEY395_115 [Arthrobacter phage Odyssey395]|nr:hypothetical protein SEA_ODYSSEY395_115 [Arthrobacter phage Odyssey395]